jgi:hypothetical protein
MFIFLVAFSGTGIPRDVRGTRKKSSRASLAAGSVV